MTPYTPKFKTGDHIQAVKDNNETPTDGMTNKNLCVIDK